MIASTIARSDGVVILMFAVEPSTTSTRTPVRSTKSASSVAMILSLTARRCAATSTARRNACGVCACHSPARATVAAIAPSRDALQRVGHGYCRDRTAGPRRRRDARLENCRRRQRTRRVVHYHQLALRTGQSERDSNRILTLDAARRNLDRHAKPGRRGFGACRTFESFGHCYHNFANRTDLSDGAERIRQHRAAADLYERLGHARPKPHADPRRNDDRRGCQFAAARDAGARPAFATKLAIVAITAAST